MDLNRRLPRISTNQGALVARPNVPRSTFQIHKTHKATFEVGYLVPIYLDEVIPSDVHRGEVTIFIRLATMQFPLMDNMYIETAFFFVPFRLCWSSFTKFMGEQVNPGDSIAYTIPMITSPAGGYPVGSIFDHFGLPVAGMLGGGATVQHSAIPLRAYNRIYNDWYRDQNLQSSVNASTSDAGEAYANYNLLRRNKRHDYFTSALPWPLKGGVDVSIGGLLGQIPVKGIAIPTQLPTTGNPTADESVSASAGQAASGWPGYFSSSTHTIYFRGVSPSNGADPWIYADASTGTGATINQLRLAFQTQVFLEIMARGGSRYTEILTAHWGVRSEDARLQRPEYIGGGRTNIRTEAIPQTSGTGASGTTLPLGALAGAGTATDRHSFSYNATEHGYIIGLANVYADITYQQGLHRTWTRSTRLDFPWPSFNHIGEQAIRMDEIYVTGTATDDDVFGYTERYAEYRYAPSTIAGLFRSTSTGNIDEWHLAEQFGSAPALNTSFIQQTIPFSRVISAGSTATNMHVLFDSVFNVRKTRPLPMFGTPGMMDRF